MTSRHHPHRTCADGRLRTRRRGDKGSATVQAIGLATAALLVLTLLAQGITVVIGDLSARHAAQQGLQTARLTGGTATGGHDQAQAMLAEINPRGLTDVQIVVERGPQTTTVTVSGNAQSVVPGLALRVHAQAQAPTEPAGLTGPAPPATPPG